jgi:hypothetical protein
MISMILRCALLIFLKNDYLADGTARAEPKEETIDKIMAKC